MSRTQKHAAKVPNANYSIVYSYPTIYLYTMEQAVDMGEFGIMLQWSRPRILLCLRLIVIFCIPKPLQWRYNGRDGVSNHQPHDCLFNRLYRRRSKKTSKLRATCLCEGNSPVTGEFPAQRASNAENVSIWWCHVSKLFTTLDYHYTSIIASKITRHRPCVQILLRLATKESSKLRITGPFRASESSGDSPNKGEEMHWRFYVMASSWVIGLLTSNFSIKQSKHIFIIRYVGFIFAN